MPTWTHPSEGTKTTRSAETDDFDIECKTFNDTIRTLDNEHQRLEKLYHDRHIDTCTRRQRDHDKDCRLQYVFNVSNRLVRIGSV